MQASSDKNSYTPMTKSTDGRPRSPSVVTLSGKPYVDSGKVIGTGTENIIREFLCKEDGSKLAVKAASKGNDRFCWVNRMLVPVGDSLEIAWIKSEMTEEAEFFKKAYPEAVSDIFDIKQDGYYSFRYVQSFFAGKTLHKYANGETPLAYDDLISLLIAICNEVERIQSLDFNHGDIKWDNTLIDDQGIVRFVDFGMAYYLKQDKFIRRYDENCKYYAPERVQLTPEDKRKFLPHTNQEIFSLGYMFDELLTAWCKNALPHPEGKVLELFSLFKSAMHDDPEKRPSMATIKEGLTVARKP